MKRFIGILAALAATVSLLSLAACSNSAGGSTGGATITTPSAPTATYIVTFDTDGGSTVESQTVTAGQKAARPAAEPTKSGDKTSYAFLGWYKSDLSAPFDFDTAINETTTIKAKWLEGFVTVAGSTVAGGDKFKDATLDHSAGVFVAGRSVAISTFWICDHEVTQKEYETYCKYGETAPSDTYGKGDNYPAYYVSWYDAIVYCNLRSKAEGLTPCYKLKIDGSYKNFPDGWTGIVSEGGKYCGPAIDNSDWHRRIEFDASANGYRLPTEAEWEYAARGGKAGCEAANPTDWAGTDSEAELGKYAWYDGNSGAKTHEVKTKTKNSLGLYDMSGNVYEWCWDWDGRPNTPSITSSTPATGASSGWNRVFRDGGFNLDANDCSVALRSICTPGDRIIYMGFRVVRAAN